MIGKDPIQAKTLVAAIRDVARISTLDSLKQQEFDTLSESALLSTFPGAVLAIPRANEPTVYYGISCDSFEWRRLRPLLVAFAGPTITRFTGWPEPLLQENSVEAFLLQQGFHIVARLEPGTSPRLPEMARRSLQRMMQLLCEAPVTTHAAPIPTSQVISLFIEALNGNNRTVAEEAIELCRTELRLDALNLSFMEVQVLAHFQDWRGIRYLANFTSLCHTRKPPAVTSALLEALYQCHLAELSVDEQIEAYRNDVRQLARPLLRLPIPAASGAGAMRLYALQALNAEPRRSDLESEVWSRRKDIGQMARHLEEAGRIGVASQKTPSEEDTLARVQRAVADAQASENLSQVREALSLFSQLEIGAQQELLRKEWFAKALKFMDAEFGTLVLPKNWQEWFDKLHDPEFTSAFSVLKRAVSDWPVTTLIDSCEIRSVSESINNVPDVLPAIDRLADALPLLVAWSADDPEFPRPALTPLYEALFYHLLLCQRRSRSIYESSALLIRALLSVGLSKGQYGSLLDDCLELAGIGVGTRNVYWLLDLVEETIANSTPDTERRQGFWNEVSARLLPLHAHLTPGQRVSAVKLATTLGWGDIAAEKFAFPIEGDRQIESFSAALTGISIGIYSLTESASRQASQALTAIAPGVKITLSNDKCGTNALKSAAQNADIYVIATASAKHAATGFIQQHRPKQKPTLFASGRGFSSIIRVIEEYLIE